MMKKENNYKATLTAGVSVRVAFIFFIFACVYFHPEEGCGSASTDLRSLVSDLRSYDSEKAGEAAVSLLKMSDTINKSIIRLACSTAARVKSDMARPWMLKIVLNKFWSEDQGKDITFDPLTRSICDIAVGKTTFIETLQEDNKGQDDKEKKEDVEVGSKYKVMISSNVIEALIATLDKSVPVPIRAASARSMGYTYSKKVVCPLYEIFNTPDENPLVRYAASDSLTKVANFIVNIQHDDLPSCSPGPIIPPGGSFVTSACISSAENYFLLYYGNLVGMALPPPNE